MKNKKMFETEKKKIQLIWLKCVCECLCALHGNRSHTHRLDESSPIDEAIITKRANASFMYNR